jgi:hypothetical protein
MRIRTLRDLARAINDLDNGYEATVEKSWSNTDTKLAGTRLRTEGKGRDGLRIKVRDPKGEVILDHDTSETYRTVREAVREAVNLFGINADPDLIPIGATVRVYGLYRLTYGTVKSVKMESGRAQKYGVRLHGKNRSEEVFPFEPRDLAWCK